MINLLPYDTKAQTRAARLNVILVRYVIILGISAGFLALACMVTYFFITDSLLFVKPPAPSSSSSKIQSDAAAIQANLAKAKSILDQQVSYGKVISAITNALPSGTKLNSLSINDGSFGTTTNLQVLATTANHESALKTSFSSPPYFSNYKLVSTTASQDQSSKYPFNISISVTINRVATQ